MLEHLSVEFLYNLFKDIAKKLYRRRRLSPSVKISFREKWKDKFEAEVYKNYKENLRTDIIIRDVQRFDLYPEVNSDKGISPWFRVALLDTYHGGILVWLRWDALVEVSEGVFRNVDFEYDKEEGITVALAGKIPYHSIESVDFYGDEYYSYPHIYCHFEHNGEPYESIDYYAEFQRNGFPPHYTMLSSLVDVKKNNKSTKRKRKISGLLRKLRLSD